MLYALPARAIRKSRTPVRGAIANLVTRSIAACLVVLMGGAVSAGAQAVVVHPNAENLKPILGERSVRRIASSSSSPELRRSVERLRASVLVDSIGTLDGPVATVLGLIRDVSVAGDGTLLVLDRANRSVRAFDKTGNPLFVLGRNGAGPADLRTPVSAWGKSANQITVYDASLGVKHFVRGRGGQFTVPKVVPISLQASAACSVGNRIFAAVQPWSSKPDSNFTVSASDSTGRIIQRFGGGYRSESNLVRSSMSEGQIACASSGTVISSLVKLPFIFGFRPDGSRAWTIRLEDFTIGRILQRQVDGRELVGLDPERPTTSITLQIREVLPGFAAVQLGLVTPEAIRARTFWSTIDTYLVDTRTGETAFVSDKLPLLGGSDGNRLYGFDNDPFPRILVYQLRN